LQLLTQKLFLLKTTIYTFWSVILLASCGQAAQQQRPVAKQDTTVVSPPMLSDDQAKRYGNAAHHFFDSILSNSFNGGVLVAKNGQVVYEHYNGFKKLEHRKDSVDSHTAFHLASVSKTFTAMATLKLWQDGKLNINDDVSKYLSGFPIQGLTVKMLLSHRSGLLNYVHFMDRSSWDKTKYLTNQDILLYIINHRTEVQGAPPGKHFEYSNTNFALLALIIEKASGESYAEYLSKTFFQPLQMTDTYVFSLANLPTAMESYKRNGRPYGMEYLDVVYGDKNIFSTPRDLLKWDEALRGGNLFTKTTLDSAYMPYSFEKAGKRNYGLGWRMLLIPNGKKLIYHNGWWHGNRTAFVRLIDEDATIIALSNNDYTKVYSSKKLADLFGDYEQSGENFEESDLEPASRGGEPAVNKTVVHRSTVAHKRTTKHVVRKRRAVIRKKKKV
jgi:CubicO group peptidase (beta-lactamase class C family)